MCSAVALARGLRLISRQKIDLPSCHFRPKYTEVDDLVFSSETAALQRLCHNRQRPEEWLASSKTSRRAASERSPRRQPWAEVGKDLAPEERKKRCDIVSSGPLHQSILGRIMAAKTETYAQSCIRRILTAASLADVL